MTFPRASMQSYDRVGPRPAVTRITYEANSVLDGENWGWDQLWIGIVSFSTSRGVREREGAIKLLN